MAMAVIAFGAESAEPGSITGTKDLKASSSYHGGFDGGFGGGYGGFGVDPFHGGYGGAYGGGYGGGW